MGERVGNMLRTTAIGDLRRGGCPVPGYACRGTPMPACKQSPTHMRRGPATHQECNALACLPPPASPPSTHTLASRLPRTSAPAAPLLPAQPWLARPAAPPASASYRPSPSPRRSRRWASGCSTEGGGSQVAAAAAVFGGSAGRDGRAGSRCSCSRSREGGEDSA